MIRTVLIVSSNRRVSSFEQREAFWLSFGKIVISHFSGHSSEDNNVSDYSDSEISTDTMDDLEDVFDDFEGDFDILTVYEAGYDADSEDDD